MCRGAPPRDGALVIGLRRLGRVLEHEPGDLTATAEAGITLDALQAALGTGGQWLPLDPPASATATLGGVLAANAAGPRRQGYGTARDLVIGMRVVAADGQLIRAGGKVVKNVAGYDLVKLYIGSLGTLGIIVDATLKLRPRPETEGACWATFATLEGGGRGGRGPRGLGARCRWRSRCSTRGPPTRARRRSASRRPPRPPSWSRSTGSPAPSRGRGRRRPGGSARPGRARVEALDAGGTARALGAVREARRLLPSPVAIATGGVLPAEVGAYLAGARATAQAGGFELAAVAQAGHGLVTLVLAPGGAPRPAAATAAVLAAWREAARARGGHLAVEWAPLGVREACPVWDPPGPAVELMRGLKARLDPQGVLNPGRFVGGI